MMRPMMRMVRVVRMMHVMRMRNVPRMMTVRAGKGRRRHGQQQQNCQGKLLHGTTVARMAARLDLGSPVNQIGQSLPEPLAGPVQGRSRFPAAAPNSIP
jgi:hypothetical protein